tara:strand:+ start:3577 stop:3753 length:177 start_codon:yes stop_codon:yes gene_type:complete
MALENNIVIIKQIDNVSFTTNKLEIGPIKVWDERNEISLFSIILNNQCRSNLIGKDTS